MCPAMLVSSLSQFSAVSALVENSRKDTDVVVFAPQFISLLLINGRIHFEYVKVSDDGLWKVIDIQI